MADLRVPARLPAAGPAPARPMPPARVEAVRAAQRAFFETALAGETQAASTPAAASLTAAIRATTPVTPPAPVATAPTFEPGAPPPARPLRPGSLLDIKV